MANYTRRVKADAYQILFSEADKAAAAKGIPVSVYGASLRYADGQYSVLVDLAGQHRHVFEGEWVVDGKEVWNDEDFEDTFSEVHETETAIDHDPVEEAKVPVAEIPPPSEPAEPLVPATPVATASSFDTHPGGLKTGPSDGQGVVIQSGVAAEPPKE